jgi:ketosteroid isomerase-like protein
VDTKAVLDHHLAAFSAGDVDALLEDYTDESLFISPDATVKGREALHAAFTRIVSGLFKPGTYDFTMDVVKVEGDIAYMVWHASCGAAEVVFATDTFVVRDGKIAVQTFAAKIDPK